MGAKQRISGARGGQQIGAERPHANGLRACGRAAARRRDVHMGRKPKLTDYQQAEALKRLTAGESCRAVTKSCRVHHATVSRLRRVTRPLRQREENDYG